jgi:hypothetical protein
MDAVKHILRQCLFLSYPVAIVMASDGKPPEPTNLCWQFSHSIPRSDQASSLHQQCSPSYSSTAGKTPAYFAFASRNIFPLSDTATTPGSENGEPQEMTHEVFTRLNNLPFPKPSGLFAMDGDLDTSAALLASHDGVQLYAAIRGSQLYVAINPSMSQHADMFVFIAFTPGEPLNAPFGKRGKVGAWSAFLGERYGDTSASWYDVSSSPLKNIADEEVGSVLEGVIDFELLAGTTPSAIYLAVGEYQRTKGGRLIAKLPVGRNDGNIVAGEFYKLAVPSVSRNK